MKYIQNSGCVSKEVYSSVMAKRQSKKVVTLCKILKSGKPGKPIAYEIYGEKNAQEVIARLERLNPGSRWVEA